MPRAPRPIFTQRWQDGLARSVETAMPAVVRIFTVGESVYVPEENDYAIETVTLYGPTEGVPGSGKARVQPLRSSRYEIQPMDSTYVQTILISIPIGEAQGVDFRPGNQARVLESPLNTINTDYQYVLNEIVDSSNPFERTLLFTVNLETAVD